MIWGVGVDLFEAYSQDVSSHIFTAIAGWKFKSSFTDILLHTILSGMGAKEFPAPWDVPAKQATADEIREIEEWYAENTSMR